MCHMLAQTPASVTGITLETAGQGEVELKGDKNKATPAPDNGRPLSPVFL